MASNRGEPIPVQPRPEPGWEEQQAKLQTCWWHSRPCLGTKVRELHGDPICWDGWVSLLHATGTCSGECYYETEPSIPENERTMRTCLEQTR